MITVTTYKQCPERSPLPAPVSHSNKDNRSWYTRKQLLHKCTCQSFLVPLYTIQTLDLCKKINRSMNPYTVSYNNTLFITHITVALCSILFLIKALIHCITAFIAIQLPESCKFCNSSENVNSLNYRDTVFYP